MGLLDRLNEPEKLVAKALTNGGRHSDIASDTHMSVQVVKNHLCRIYTKLNVSGRVRLGVLIYRELLERDPEPPQKPSVFLDDILDPTQVNIVHMVHEGLGPKEIGPRIGTTEEATKTRLQTIYKKLGLGNLLELALRVECESYYLQCQKFQEPEVSLVKA